MKKIIIFLCLIILCGCHTPTKVVYGQKDYQKYYNALNKNESFETQTSDFQIRFIINKLSNKQYRYDIVIDQPNIEMKNIKALAIIHKDNECPSLGILEKDKYTLQPGVVDKSQGIYKGINLSTTMKKKITTGRLFISYITNNKRVERYFQLDESEIR